MHIHRTLEIPVDRTAQAFERGLACGDGYATHLQMLGQALGSLEIPGSVLELGCGHYSTPLLHGFCNAQNRKLVTYETDVAWGSIFEHLADGGHDIHLGPWEPADIVRPPKGSKWGLVFVDCDMHLRGPAISHLMTRAHRLVLHDACNPAYGYEEALAPFSCRRTIDKTVTPWTMYVLPQ